jgi:biopolymer transport protein ExbB
MLPAPHNVLVYPFRYWASGGALLAPIACVCFGILVHYLGLRRFMLSVLREGGALEQRLARAVPRANLRDLDAMGRTGLFFGPVLARVTGAVTDGIRPATAFEREQRLEMDRLQRSLVVLAAMTALAPLLGLLGTVVGMIETFEAVSASGAETTGRIASGISKALITTQFGLMVAIPGVFGLARLRRLVHHIHTRFNTIRVGTMPAFRDVARRAAPENTE